MCPGGHCAPFTPAIGAPAPGISAISSMARVATGFTISAYAAAGDGQNNSFGSRMVSGHADLRRSITLSLGSRPSATPKISPLAKDQQQQPQALPNTDHAKAA